MKKRITFLSAFLLSLPFCVMAEEEVFPTGTTWKEVYEEIYIPEYPDSSEPMDTLYSPKVYEIGGDTIIGMMTYKQVFCNGSLWNCVIREEDGCVWMLSDDYPDEFKLYDFNWDGRDTVVTQYLHELDREKDREDVRVALEDYKLYLSPLTTEQGVQRVDYHNRIFIRGIGCVSDLTRKAVCLLGYRTRIEPLPHLTFTKVLWLRKNGKEVYRYYGKNEWTVGIEETRVSPAPPTSTKASYDLLGRKNVRNSIHGISIVWGKKRWNSK